MGNTHSSRPTKAVLDQQPSSLQQHAVSSSTNAATPKRSNLVQRRDASDDDHRRSSSKDALPVSSMESSPQSHLTHSSESFVSANDDEQDEYEDYPITTQKHQQQQPLSPPPKTAAFVPDYDDDNDDTESTTCSPLLSSFSNSARRSKLTMLTPPPPLLSAPSLALTTTTNDNNNHNNNNNVLTKATSTTSWSTFATAASHRQYKSFSSFCSFDQVQEDTKEDVCFMMNHSRSLSYNNFIEIDHPDEYVYPHSHQHHHNNNYHSQHHALLDPSSPWTSSNTATATTDSMRDEDWLPTEDSDLRPNEQRVRQFWIVTTAALPWMTGTAVNPLLRAAYLSQLNRPFLQSCDSCDTSDPTTTNLSPTPPPLSTVTLVLPWLHQAEDRVALYGAEWQHATSQDQEAYIRDWLATKAQLPLEAYTETGGIVILWYPARYHAKLSSIFAMGDICSLLATGITAPTATSSTTTTTTTIASETPPSTPERHSPPSPTPPTSPSQTTTIDDETNAVMGDVCILEEPEHVNFYRAPGKLSWRHRFRHVVGIMHTNYKAYASHSYHGIVTAPIVGALSSWMVRAYCDRVIKLSPVLQEYASEKEVICNVHGIRHEFLYPNSTTTMTTTSSSSSSSSSSCPTNKRGIYFLGKLLWAKGLDRLLELEAVYRKMTGDYFSIDIYGSGPEQEEIQRAFCGQPIKEKQASQQQQQPSATTTTTANGKSKAGASRGKSASSSTTVPLPWYFYYHNHKKKIPARFMGRQDHAVLHDYKIFVNPSVTEVLCTTTAEALAMGKLVIIPFHPSNTWFTQFPNCFQYQSPKEFVQFLQYALLSTTIPAPLSPQLLHVLSWEAATERFLQAASIRRLDAPRLRSTEALDHRLAQFHYELGKGVKGDVLRKVLGGGPVADQVQYMNEPTTTTAVAVA